MLKLFAFNTTNCHKVVLLLEELGLKYEMIPINIREKEQFLEAYLNVHPGHQVPALIDKETGVKVFESSAIMAYLANKHNKLLGLDHKKNAEMLTWYFWQAATLARAISNVFYCYRFGETDQSRIDAYTKTLLELYTMLDKHLSNKKYIAKEEYTVADMAIYPSLRLSEVMVKVNFDNFPNIKKYVDYISTKPSVIKTYEKFDAIDWSKKYASEKDLEVLINK